MTDVQSCFISLIRNVVMGADLPNEFKSCDLVELYKLSKKQDMAHIVAYGLKKNDLIDVNSDLWRKNFNKQYFLAQFRVMNLEHEYGKVCDVLETSEIDYIPLKGAVIRPLYPAAWMRVSSDIDLLVQKDDLIKSEKTIANTLNYIIEGSDGKKGYHEHLKSPNGFVVEMHWLLSDREVPSRTYMDDVWNRASLFGKTKHKYKLDDDLFYLYHIFHASKHFKDGGCGTRVILDTWFINNKLGINSTKCAEMLKKSELYEFALAIEGISKKWFDGDNSDKYDLVEGYIFNGGVYGEKNRYAAWQSETDGKSIAYYLKRAFPPYKYMCQRYLELKGKPLLLPYYWLKRIATAFGKKDGKRTKAEIKTAWLEKEKSKKIKAMFDELGL